MAKDLNNWLQKHALGLTKAVLYRAPNMLPDAEDITAFILLLAEQVGRTRESQVTAVQSWALTTIGFDAHAAGDWLTVLHVLKEAIAKRVQQEIPLEEALSTWLSIDDFFTYALIEASHLASDIDHAALLEHAQSLRAQMAEFEKSKSNFVAVAAHELKTPLTLLEGYANMIRYESAPDSRLMLYVEGLSNGFRRMYEIINDMIDVSLIDLKGVELNYTQFYLERIILGVADNLDKYFFERQVDLVIMPLGEELRIYGDQEKLVNAFTKVLLNALKFTPNGGKVTVSSAVTRQEEALDNLMGYIQVKVTDTGIGINPENLEMIFDKFTSTMDVNLHSSSKTNYKGGGPGLGLAIGRGIIQAHGGRIWAESEKCDEANCPGATFYIELPIWQKAPIIQRR